MTREQAFADVFAVAVPVVTFLGVVAVILTGLSLIREIGR